MNNPSEQFDEFDYGSRSNAQKYGTLSPPEYELRNVQIPVGIFSGREESLNTFEVFCSDNVTCKLIYSFPPKNCF